MDHLVGNPDVAGGLAPSVGAGCVACRVDADPILAGRQLAYECGGDDQYGDAVHDVALAAITGEPTGGQPR